MSGYQSIGSCLGIYFRRSSYFFKFQILLVRFKNFLRGGLTSGGVRSKKGRGKSFYCLIPYISLGFSSLCDAIKKPRNMMNSE